MLPYQVISITSLNLIFPFLCLFFFLLSVDKFATNYISNFFTFASFHKVHFVDTLFLIEALIKSFNVELFQSKITFITNTNGFCSNFAATPSFSETRERPYIGPYIQSDIFEINIFHAKCKDFFKKIK